MGTLAYAWWLRGQAPQRAPFRRCWRCRALVLRDQLVDFAHRGLTWRQLVTRVVAEVGGYRALHPQVHCGWFRECVDRDIHDLAEFVDREVAHTDMSCQGDEFEPAWLIVTIHSWPALRVWLAARGYRVVDTLQDDPFDRADIRASGFDVVAKLLPYDEEHDIAARVKVSFGAIPAVPVSKEDAHE